MWVLRLSRVPRRQGSTVPKKCSEGHTSSLSALLSGRSYVKLIEWSAWTKPSSHSTWKWKGQKRLMKFSQRSEQTLRLIKANFSSESSRCSPWSTKRRKRLEDLNLVLALFSKNSKQQLQQRRTSVSLNLTSSRRRLWWGAKSTRSECKLWSQARLSETVTRPWRSRTSAPLSLIKFECSSNRWFCSCSSTYQVNSKQALVLQPRLPVWSCHFPCLTYCLVSTR